ncbi:MAG: TIGR02300 family protein [Alphaproteobacteria bacterium]
MARPEWGSKRTCTSCGTRFYDLRRSPIRCPKCDAPFEPDAPVRSHRPAAVPKKTKPAAPPVPLKGLKPGLPEVEDDAVLIAGVDDDAEILVGADVDDEDAGIEEVEGDGDDALMEDASDLGGDDEDMAEVMEHMEDDPRES